MLDMIKSAVQMEDWKEAYKLCIVLASKIRKNIEKGQGLQTSIELIKEADRPGSVCSYCGCTDCECVERIYNVC